MLIFFKLYESHILQRSKNWESKNKIFKAELGYIFCKEVLAFKPCDSWILIKIWFNIFIICYLSFCPNLLNFS